MRSGFRSVYILLLACTTSTKQHELLLDFEHHFRLFSTTAMMPSGRIRKIRSQPNFKRKFSRNFWFLDRLHIIYYIAIWETRKIFLNISAIGIYYEYHSNIICVGWEVSHWVACLKVALDNNNLAKQN